jgi:hypothetical protein
MNPEQILTQLCKEHENHYPSFPAFVENEDSIEVYDLVCRAMEASIVDLKNKNKEANEFIIDIANLLNIVTDGLGYDGLQLTIDDFKDAIKR